MWGREIISQSKRLMGCRQDWDAEALTELRTSVSKFIAGELKNKVCCLLPSQLMHANDSG